MSGTDAPDTDVMNNHVAKMVEEALKYNNVESVLENGEQEDIFSPEYFEKLSDIQMPATRLELLIKLLRKQIQEYSKTNQIAAKKYQEMLEETIKQYHERRKHLTAEEAGATQEQASEDIIKSATDQAIAILNGLNESRESFRKMGLTFEEKAFYDVLVDTEEKYNFEYPEEKNIYLAKEIYKLVTEKGKYADWMNRNDIKAELQADIIMLLYNNGFPPLPEGTHDDYEKVYSEVIAQAENFKKYYNE